MRTWWWKNVAATEENPNTASDERRETDCRSRAHLKLGVDLCTQALHREDISRWTAAGMQSLINP